MQAIGKAHLHETGPGTLMGQLLRRFWHPVAPSDSIEPGSAPNVSRISSGVAGRNGAPIARVSLRSCAGRRRCCMVPTRSGAW